MEKILKSEDIGATNPARHPTRAASAPILAIVLALALAVIILAALLLGRAEISVFDAFGDDAVAATARQLLLEVRLPRVLGAGLIGAALAVAGLASQVALRNPLASPDLLGVSAGAGLGACAAMLANAPAFGIAVAAFAGGLVATSIVGGLANRLYAHTGRDPILLSILIGVAISSFCAAGIAALKWFADPLSKLPAMTFWLLGGLSGINWRDVTALVTFIALALFILWRRHGQLGAIELGDDVAQSLGAPVNALRWQALAAAALATAAAVAVGGMLGWLALIVPHIARTLQTTARPWRVTALIGAIILVVVDTLCRTLADSELPPGVVLALLGAPGLLWVLRRVAVST